MLKLGNTGGVKGGKEGESTTDKRVEGNLVIVTEMAKYANENQSLPDQVEPSV